MKKESVVRYAAAALLGLGVAALAHLAFSSSGSAGLERERIAQAEAAAGQAGQSMRAVDDALSAMAGRLAAAGRPASEGSSGAPLLAMPSAQFKALSQSLFRRADAASAVVLFHSAPDQASAEAVAQPVAEGVAQFRAGGRSFFLAASHVAGARNVQPGVFPFSGSGGRLPFVLAAGPEAQRSLGAALSADAHVASGLFGVEQSALAPVAAVALNDVGVRAFWRFAPVYGQSAGGASQAPIGVLGALIDVPGIFAAAPSNASVHGPLEAVMLPSVVGGPKGANRIEAAVPLGAQGFMLSIPVEAVAGGASGLLGPVLAGLLAALAALLIARSETRSRMAAEAKLLSHRRKFRKRSAELKNSEDRFKRLAESTNVIPWAANLKDRRFTYIGPQIEKLSGYPARSWYATSYWVDHVHPEDRHRIFVEGFKGLQEGEYATLEYRIRSADGKVMHIRNMMTLNGGKNEKGEREMLAQGYMLDITEMKTAQGTLDEARREAERANRTKSEFLANMSHELRTPLNAVIGFSEVMKDELFGPMGERYRDYAESVHSSGKHLLDLINDVLDLSKIEAGKIELIEEETDVGVILSKCRTLLHERASSAGLHIRLEIPAPLPFVMIDGRRIKQIILNLMSNSVKFTPPGGRITLRAEVVPPKGLKIVVADSGIGMTREEIDIALEQFGQIDNELSRQHDGTGLGLPIARSLAEIHGGSLEVESRKNAGTSITLWLPMTRIVHRKGEEPDQAVGA